jgi:hypothetical protein
VASVAILKLYAQYVEKFGAVAKYTFIVQPKKLYLKITKNQLIVVKAAAKVLQFIKNRVIMLYRNKNG